MHIHLDPVGGIAGDMFAAALLDAFPDLTERVVGAIRLSGLDRDVTTDVLDFSDGVLTGKRFDVHKNLMDVTAGERSPLYQHHHSHAPGHGHHAHHHAGHHRHDHAHDHGPEAHRHQGHDNDHGHHDHTHWADLKAHLSASGLPEGIKKHTIGIFGELAWAEAKVHGKAVDTVTFHEVGNWDSIADIVAAATLIDALAAESWSVGSLPLGFGRVKTAHGELPVPAPATTLLLEGFAFHQDGRPGERVTPTGAAILRYLAPAQGIGSEPRALRAFGHGFGSRKIAGLSNILRVLAFDRACDTTGTADTVGVIQFEIDDQSGEDLAVALDHIRAEPGVIDVIQAMALGKKGRMMAAIQVLVKPAAMQDVATACFRQTTTLGLRTRLEARTILARNEVEGRGLRVKIADRPGGPTAKAESDAVADDARGHQARSAARREAEAAALKVKP